MWRRAAGEVPARLCGRGALASRPGLSRRSVVQWSACALAGVAGGDKPRRSLRRRPLIRLPRLNNYPFVVNVDLIKTLEARPDTTITLTTGETLIVKEKVDEVVARAVEYGRMVRTFRP